MKIYTSVVSDPDRETMKRIEAQYPHFFEWYGVRYGSKKWKELPKNFGGFECCGYVEIRDLDELLDLIKFSDKELCFSERDGQYSLVYYNDYRE